MRPEDRVVSDRNSHEQQADERRSSRGHRGKVGVVHPRHHANRNWHGRSVMSIGWTLAQTWTGTVVIVTALAHAELSVSGFIGRDLPDSQADSAGP
jgi:hypothetical protein